MNCNEYKKLGKDRLYVFATKLRQQFIGNLRSCTGHPDGGMGIKQRSNLLNDDNRILEAGFQIDTRFLIGREPHRTRFYLETLKAACTSRNIFNNSK